MRAKDIIDRMSDDDVIEILLDLGSRYPKSVNDDLLFQTVCHCGRKHKLHYHKDNKSFYCYSNCGSISNIFNLVMKVKDCSFDESYKYICNKLNITFSILDRHGFQEENDNSFIDKFKIQKEHLEPPKIRDESVLNQFRDLYHHTWIKDHISVEVMKMFNIKFDILNNAIIIPHYNINGELIGIRARYLNDYMIESGKKYMPITINDVLYNYPTSMNLYGLNINKDNIKKYKHVIIGEAEKFVMQHRSIYEDSTAVALNGSALSQYQIDLLLELGVETVVLGLDKEFETDEEEEKYKMKINKSFVMKLIQYFRVEIIWDRHNYIGLKDSPLDKGPTIYKKLYNERIILS